MQITQLLGTPDKEFVDKIESDATKKFVKELPENKAADFFHHFKDFESNSAVDLLTNMLVYDPSKRFTAQQCLEHPYFENLHCEDDEPVGDMVQLYDFEFEMYHLKT